MTVTLDFETRSKADLGKVGTWAYSEHPSTEIICAAWGVGTEPIRTWIMGNPPPLDLFTLIRSPALIEAHNVAFEKSIWANVAVKRLGWPRIGAEQWRDTMAVAAYYGLPQALHRLAHALGFEGKDPEGGRLITRYSKLYLPTSKIDIPASDLHKFVAYCVKDVAIEQSVSDMLGDLPERELPIWFLDQEMNERGIGLDITGIYKASEIVDQRADELTREYQALTGVSPTQRDKSLEWFLEHGCPLENMQADYLEEVLDDLPSGPVRQAVTIRLAINKASTKKLDAMARNAGLDGRARFQTRYHGAATGRNTGVGLQPLNLNRGFPDMEPEQLVADVMHGDAAFLDALYGNAMDAVAKASRYWIKAAPGHKIVAGDFASVEAIVLACLAGEEWKVNAFASGVKIYEAMADKIYRLPPGTVTKATHPLERQDGKTGELAFGYQGALGAWLKFDDSGRHTDEAIVGFCKAWRMAHPMTVDFWGELELSALEAMRHPKELHRVANGLIAFQIVDERDGSGDGLFWLTMILPNGKRLWYYRPEIRVGMPHWHQPAYDAETGEPNEHAAKTCDCRPVPKLTYMATKEGQWKRVFTYGGKLTENAVQATSRELLCHAALRAQAAGYPVILTVYDEIVTEPPLDFGSASGLVELMEDMPQWATGWPIRAVAWEGDRYRK